MCITVAILGIALVPLMLSVATASKTSDYIAQRSAAEGYARQIVEIVRAQNGVPQTCPAANETLKGKYKANIASALDASGKESADFSFDVSHVTVAYAADLAGSSFEPSSWSQSCDGSGTIPNATLVEITVASKTDASVTTTASTVQRKKVVS